MEINCMVVDDDEISRLLVKKFIEKTDFLKLTYEFDSAVAASEILMKDSPSDVDLVFLDVEIPEMSGID
ncbi:MAG: response regulator, partial [Cyclobacteriaceae bacterium]